MDDANAALTRERTDQHRSARVSRRGRASRLAPAALALAGTLALALGTALATASPDGTTNPPTAEDIASIPEGPAAEPFAETGGPLPIPDETPASDASETEHQGLSAEAVAELASQEFPELMNDSGFEPVNPPPGMQIGGYIDDYAAIIEPTDNPMRDFDPDDEAAPAEPGAIVVSGAMPLRAEDEAGHLRPIDTELVPTDGRYEQGNALVDVRVPEEIADGVEIAGSGLGLEPAGAAAADPVEFIDEKAVYANLGGSPTDLIVAGMPAGFQFMLQLRSDSDPVHRIKLALPEGAELETSTVDPGGVDVVDGAAILGSISAPVAVDAANREVPVEMRAEGDQVVLEVSHLEAGWELPIMIDPVYDYFGWRDSGNPGGYPTDIAGWEAISDHPAKFTGYFANGLHSRSNPSTVYPSGAYHQWRWQAPPNTFIERVDFYNATHVTLPQDPEVENNFQGIWGSSGWQSGQMYYRGGFYDGSPAPVGPLNAPPNWVTPYNTGWDYEWYSFDHWVGNNRLPDWSGPDPEGTDGNLIAFGLQMFDRFATNRQCCARSQLRGALISLYDRNRPAMTSAKPNRGWVDDTTSPNHFVDAAATDVGLGMKSFAFYVNRLAQDGTTSYQQATASCAGPRYSRCPASYSTRFNYQLPEGKNTIELIPYDIVGWYAEPWQTWTEGVDRTPPQLQVTGGLRDIAGNVDASGRDLYDLRVVATDGQPNGPDRARQSGVRDVVIKVDGVNQMIDPDVGLDDPNGDPDRATSPASCQDSCQVTIDDFVFDTDSVSEGQHTISVVAFDRVGHRTEQSWTINVPRESYYTARLAEWRQATELRVDQALPGVPLTGPMPAIPSDWSTPNACLTEAATLGACYDRIVTWGSQVRTWLQQNLPLSAITGLLLPNPPVFSYAKAATGIDADLSARLRDAFAFNKAAILDPTKPITVGLGFHEPVSVQQLTTLLPSLPGSSDVTLQGIFGPGTTNISGTGNFAIGPGTSLADAIDSFYQEQIAITDTQLADVAAQPINDIEDLEDYWGAYDELQALRQHLVQRQPFIKAISVTLANPLALDLSDPLGLIGSLKGLAIPTTDDPSGTADAGIAALSTDSGTVATFRSIEGPQLRAAADSRYQTCDQRNQGHSRQAQSTLYPSPVYYAPSRFSYDTLLGPADPFGDHHLKLHKLHFRWKFNGLAWLCGDEIGDRGVEMEAMVYPDDEGKWSTNWQEGDVGNTVARSNLPEPLHLDDLADGNGYPFDKSEFPDFSILTESGRAFQYRRPYWVYFYTDAGEADTGRVIYSAQANTRAAKTNESVYCHLPTRGNYENCTFGRVTACYATEFIVATLQTTNVPWTDVPNTGPGVLGNAWRFFTLAKRSATRDYVQDNDEDEDRGNQVNVFCDARPPGSER